MLPPVHVLVADVPEGLAVFREALGRRAEFTHAATVAQALDGAQRGTHLIACGAHFDDCRMFELVEQVKSAEDTRAIPVLCFRAIEGSLPPALLRATRSAALAVGAAEFIDVFDIAARHGRDHALRLLAEHALVLAARRP